MMSVTINLEIGHDSSLRTKTTPEGFTHDWEVFVKGCNGADISHYVDKVVFILHETFAKPKRVVKEPPYSVRTSGYAGFNLPIHIYLKNNQDPKRIQFNYDLHLQPSGPPIHKVQKEKFTFNVVSEDFRSKLLRGGAVIGSGSGTDLSSKFEEKTQMSNKPKIGNTEQTKKYKIKPDEPRSNQFTDVFGTPITKTTQSVEAPKAKEPVKSMTKSNEKDKDRISILEKEKNKNRISHKDKDRDKDKDKEKIKEKQTDSDRKLKDEKKERRDKKERENSKNKRDRKDRESDKTPSRLSPVIPKKSPKRHRSPSPVKKDSSKEKDKEIKDRDREKEKRVKKYKDKDGKYKERDKDKDHGKDYKNKEGKGSKEKDVNSVSGLVKERDRDASPMVNTQVIKKDKKEKDIKEPEKSDKDREKESSKGEDKPKHKHKKKDKERKEKTTKKEKEERKSEKERFSSGSSKDLSSSKDRDKTNNLFGHSPKIERSPSPHKPVSHPVEDDSSNISKSSREPSPIEIPPHVSQRTPTPPQVPRKSMEEPAVKKVSTDDSLTTPTKKKEKKDKKREKKGDKDHEKKKKRKIEADTQVEIDEPSIKKAKREEDRNNNSDDEKKVSSTEDGNPILYSDDGEAYMTMLRELQHKIMGLKDNSDLQKVVQLIAETGRYEVSAHTFDFDLCLLDKSTVMQLQSFFSPVN